MMDFFTHVETQYKTKVVMVHFDNAPELCQGLMKELFLQRGLYIKLAAVILHNKMILWRGSIDTY